MQDRKRHKAEQLKHTFTFSLTPTTKPVSQPGERKPQSVEFTSGKNVIRSEFPLAINRHLLVENELSEVEIALVKTFENLIKQKFDKDTKDNSKSHKSMTEYLKERTAGKNFMASLRENNIHYVEVPKLDRKNRNCIELIRQNDGHCIYKHQLQYKKKKSASITRVTYPGNVSALVSDINQSIPIQQKHTLEYTEHTRSAPKKARNAASISNAFLSGIESTPDTYPHIVNVPDLISNTNPFIQYKIPTQNKAQKVVPSTIASISIPYPHIINTPTLISNANERLPEKEKNKNSSTVQTLPPTPTFKAYSPVIPAIRVESSSVISNRFYQNNFTLFNSEKMQPQTPATPFLTEDYLKDSTSELDTWFDFSPRNNN